MHRVLPPFGTPPARFTPARGLNHRLTLIVTAEALRPVRKLIARAIHDLRVPLGPIRQEPLAQAPLRYQLSGEFPGSPEQAHRLMRLLLAHLSLPHLVLARLETLGEAARGPECESERGTATSRAVRECRDIHDGPYTQVYRGHPTRD